MSKWKTCQRTKLTERNSGAGRKTYERECNAKRENEKARERERGEGARGDERSKTFAQKSWWEKLFLLIKASVVVWTVLLLPAPPCSRRRIGCEKKSIQFFRSLLVLLLLFRRTETFRLFNFGNCLHNDNDEQPVCFSCPPLVCALYTKWTCNCCFHCECHVMETKIR